MAVIVLACAFLLFVPNTQGTKRYLMGDESVYDILHRLENLIASLNSTFSQDIAGLRSSVQSLQGSTQTLQSGLQTETKQRCQAGNAQFHKIECSFSSCSETVQVHFNPGFPGTPIIHYGSTWLDAEHAMNLRYNIYASSVTATSMALTVSTRADTRLFGMFVSWMACPP